MVPKVKNAKNSKLSKLSENCFEPIGKGEWPPISIWIILFKEVFKLCGILRYIVSDRDNRFLSAFWQDLLRLSRTDLTPSTNYHPQTNGQAEIINYYIEGYLRNCVSR
jgi:hypothetical protein